MNMEPGYMERCLQLAALGTGKVSPNPMVGCVIVHDNKIISEGYHQAFGGPHAEVSAIKNLPENYRHLLKESTLYVNLEPCSHFGKTPPCAKLIVRHQVPQVVVAALDPNPAVSGNGVKHLMENNIKVKCGLLEEEAKWLNRRFYSFHQKQRPYIILKWAESKDGLAGREGKQIKITNDRVQRLVHKWRSEEMAIMVGTTTALTDNPQLDARLSNGQNPLRIVPDRNLKIPTGYHLKDGSTPTWILTEKKHKDQKNLKFIQLPFDEQMLPALSKRLYEANINSLFVEGGPTLQNKFIRCNLWDEVRILTGQDRLENGIPSPKITGEIKGEATISGDRLTIIKNIR